MKDNTGSLGERLLSLENEMRALEEAGIGGAELRKVKDEVAVLILMNGDIFFRIVGKRFLRFGGKIPLDSEKEDREDLLTDLIIHFYDKYDVRKGSLFPFLTMGLHNKIIDNLRKESIGLEDKDRKEGQKKQYKRRRESISKLTRINEDFEGSLEDATPDWKMDQERDIVAALIVEEAFLNLSALVTCFFEERDRRSGTEKGFRYYKATYTQGLFNYVKGEGMVEPPAFQHEADIIRAADEAFANFVTLHHPYSSKEPLEIRKIFFYDLECNRAVSPSYAKSPYPDKEIAIPMKPFVIGGYMERVHHMKVSASLVTQQMSRYEKDAAEVLHQIGIQSKRYKENAKIGIY